MIEPIARSQFEKYNALLKALSSGRLGTPREIQIFTLIFRETIGWQRSSVRLSFNNLSAITSIPQPHVCTALQKLLKKHFIKKTRHRQGKFFGTSEYEVHPHFFSTFKKPLSHVDNLATDSVATLSTGNYRNGSYPVATEMVVTQDRQVATNPVATNTKKGFKNRLERTGDQDPAFEDTIFKTRLTPDEIFQVASNLATSLHLSIESEGLFQNLKELFEDFLRELHKKREKPIENPIAFCIGMAKRRGSMYKNGGSQHVQSV